MTSIIHNLPERPSRMGRQIARGRQLDAYVEVHERLQSEYYSVNDTNPELNDALRLVFNGFSHIGRIREHTTAQAYEAALRNELDQVVTHLGADLPGHPNSQV